MSPRRLALLAGLLLVAPACALFRPDPPVYDAVRFDSGLVIRDLVVPVQGAPIASGDTVALHYELRLADRTLVESSRDTGQPVRFEVGAGTVPRGLEEGVIGMRLFGRRRIEIPSALAYGDEGRPPRIPPGAALTFEVEVMEHVPRP